MAFHCSRCSGLMIHEPSLRYYNPQTSSNDSRLPFDDPAMKCPCCGHHIDLTILRNKAKRFCLVVPIGHVRKPRVPVLV